jgi:hypothetical protein
VVRTVRVRLELDRTDFKQGLRESAGDLRAFDTEVKTLGKDSERTGTQLKTVGDGASKLGDDVKRSSREVDGLGNSSTKTTTKVKTLDTQIREARASVRQLGEEFLRTKDVDVFEKMRAAGGDLAGLQRTKKDLNDLVGEFDSVGKRGGKAMEEGLGSAFRDFKAESGVLIPAAIAVAVTEGAPVIGAAVSAAVLLGLGAVGIGAGIALAFKDPAVSAAATALGKNVGDWLKAAASDSFKQPLLNAFQILGDGFDRLEPRIHRIFSDLGPSVERLAQGLVGLIDRAGPGLEHAFAAAGPLINALAAQLPRLGDAISAMFDSFARAGPGAERFLNFFMTWLDGALRGIGLVTEGLSKMFQGLTSGGGLAAILGPLGSALQGLGVFGDGTQKSFQRLKDTADPMTDSLNKVSEAAQRAGLGAQLSAQDFSALTSMMSQASQTTDALAGSMVDKLLGATLGLDQATLGFAQAQTSLGEALKANHSNIDISSAKGQALREAVLGVVGANLREYDTTLAVTGSAKEAAAAWDRGTAALEGQLRKAGLTTAQIDQLIGKYRSVPQNVDTDIAVNGLTTAINNLDETLRLINGLHSRTIYIDVVQRHSLVPQAIATGGVVSYAQGGIHDYKMSLSTDYTARSGLLKPSNPGTILAGEPSTGGEVFGPRLGVSHERGLQLAGVLAGWHGGMVVRPAATSGGGTSTVVHEHHVMIGYPDGRKIGELLINDAEHGGTAVTSFIRRVANR